MSTFDEKVISFTEELGLFSRPCTAIVGVSGGADSMCLLHLACSWKSKGISIIAVHVMHGIRGAEAERDADFVREQCLCRHIPLFIVRADVPTIAAGERCGLEEAGRQVRYAVFREVQRRVGADYVLTAHTASDQAETVLLNILRGCGIAGLTGIPATRDTILRPLLNCTREEVETYCAVNHVSFVHDSTNTDTQYTRNAVRHEVLPLLASVNPSVTSALLRLSRSAAEDDHYLSQIAKQALDSATVEEGVYLRERFVERPSPIRYRMLRLALLHVACRSMEERHYTIVSCMIEKGHGTVVLPGGITIKVNGTHVYLTRPSDALACAPAVCVDALPFSCHFGIYTIRLSLCTREECESLEKVHKLFFKCAVDYDTIQGGLSVRCRQIGDYMHPAGRGVGKSIKALMQEWHIPAELRDSYPVICDDHGPVLIPGYCCDERVRSNMHTNHFLVCFIDRMTT